MELRGRKRTGGHPTPKAQSKKDITLMEMNPINVPALLVTGPKVFGV